MKTLWAVKALPAGLLALAIGATAGCSSSDSDGGCDLSAKIDALGAASTKLNTMAASMRVKLATACAQIAGNDFSGSTATDEDVSAQCGDAQAAIKANVKGSITVDIVEGKCEVDAQAQLDCSAKCDVDASCQPGKIDAEVTCEAGKLSVECSGECSGTVTCEASGSASVKCEGACNGSCTGTCEGTCNGKCDGTCTAMDSEGNCTGKCDGTCTGTCSASCSGTCQGSCEYNADAKVECNAEARCQGTCTGEATAPRCEGEVKALPPTCHADADCEAGCRGQASFDAKCTPPTVVISGDVDADFAATLTANLPVVLDVMKQGEIVVNTAEDVASATGNLIAEIPSAPLCAAKVAGNVTTSLKASAEAAVSVSASVNVSAMVSASAGAS